jgi:xylan 1,4-beta-xylosidase
MQLMTWMASRLGGRFCLLFEPHRQRVMHSALGRFLDRPMDLMVGLVEPDGTERVLPFTTRGTPLVNCEQFDRINSITFRGYSEKYGLRFEFNVHSVFYPQDEAVCTLPAFYLEMRINPAGRVRWTTPAGPTPKRVKLFIRLNRPDTQITAAGPTPQVDGGRIDLTYDCRLAPRLDPLRDGHYDPSARLVHVRERIVSLNDGCAADEDGGGLSLELPVTKVGSGTKWRLVWGAHCADPILRVGEGDAARDGRFRYVQYWPTLDDVMHDAVGRRDDHLALSRRLEKLIDLAPLNMAQRHLMHQSFGAFLGNTFWCQLDARDGRPSRGSACGRAVASSTQPWTSSTTWRCST